MVLNLLIHPSPRQIYVLVIVYMYIVSNISWMKSGGERKRKGKRQRQRQKDERGGRPARQRNMERGR